MGFLATDLAPLGSQGPTVLTPCQKDVQCKVATFARTDTAGKIAMWLPADSSIISVSLFASTASNAGTSATGTITIANNGGTVSTGSANLLTGGIGATGGSVSMSNLPNLQPVPLNGDLKVTLTYAETGTVSSTGGPWTVLIQYVR